MRSKGTATELELRRRIGGKLLLQGKTFAEAADACEVSLSSVKRWKRTVRKGGLDTLAVRDSHGRFVARDFPELPRSTVFELGTLRGAAALGLADSTGSLSPGKLANLAVIGLPDRDSPDPHELLFDSPQPVLKTYYLADSSRSGFPA